MYRCDLTQTELKKHVSYDKDTGTFIRIKSIANSVSIGDITGSFCSVSGYLSICINSIQYKAHRLAVLYVTGIFPKNDIDHINHDRTDNRSKNWLVSRIDVAIYNNKDIIIQSHKKTTGKYGRLLGTVMIDGVDVNQEMIDKGLVVPYFGGKKK